MPDRDHAGRPSLEGLLDRMPFASGVWKPSPDIRPLRRSVDPRIFAAAPSDWQRVKEQMLAGPRERHVGYAKDADRSAVRACLTQVVRLLREERPNEFIACDSTLTHRGSGASWRLGDDGRTINELIVGAAAGNPAFDVEDALALSMAEDMTVVHVDRERRANRLEFVHVCFPSLWDPSAKLGLDFAAVHKPVADSERLQAAGMDLMAMCSQRGPFIRWAWGLHTDDGLNHHPLTGHVPSSSATATPTELAASTWLRLERQILLSMPEYDRVVFLIGVFVYPLTVLADRPDDRAALASTIRSMGPDALSYKSLVDRGDRLLSWLDGCE